MKRLSIAAVALSCVFSAGIFGAKAQAQLTTVTASSLKISGSPISTGKVLIKPVDTTGTPISFAQGGGGLNGPFAFVCSITAGALGTCSVPDTALTTPAHILYEITVIDTSTGQPTSGLQYTLPGVANLSGATWALDSYGPPATTTSYQALQVSSGPTVPSSCNVPSVFTKTSGGGAFYYCMGGSYTGAVGGANTPNTDNAICGNGAVNSTTTCNGKDIAALSLAVTTMSAKRNGRIFDASTYGLGDWQQSVAAAFADADSGTGGYVEAGNLSGLQPTAHAELTLVSAHNNAITIHWPQSGIWPIELNDATKCGVRVGNSISAISDNVGGEGARFYIVAASSATHLKALGCNDDNVSENYSHVTGVEFSNDITAVGVTGHGTLDKGSCYWNHLVDQSLIQRVPCRNNEGKAITLAYFSSAVKFDQIQGYSSSGSPHGGSYAGGDTTLTIEGVNFGGAITDSTFNAPGIGHPAVLITGTSTYGLSMERNNIECNGASGDTTSCVIADGALLGMQWKGGGVLSFYTGGGTKYSFELSAAPGAVIDIENVGQNDGNACLIDHTNGSSVPAAASGTACAPYKVGTPAQFQGMMATKFNRYIVMNDKQEHCTYFSLTYNSPAECAYQQARTVAIATGQPQVVWAGPGNWYVNTQLSQQNGEPPVSVIGMNKASFNGGTTFTLTADISGAMFYLPPVPSGGYWPNVFMGGFTVNAAGHAPMCWEWMAPQDSRFERIGCRNAIGARTHWRIGGYSDSLSNFPSVTCPSGYNCLGFQTYLDDIFDIKDGGTGPGAALTVTPTSGTITSGSFSWASYPTDPANNYNSVDGVLNRPLLILGDGSGNQPCTGVGSGHGNIVAGHLSSITVDTPWTGCSGTLTPIVPDISMASFSGEVALTDSTAHNLNSNSAGAVYGFNFRGAGNLTVSTLHPTGGVGGLIDFGGGNTYLDTECDSLYGDCIDAQYGSTDKPIFIERTRSIVGGNFSGATTYRARRTYSFPSAAINAIYVDKQRCTAIDANFNCTNFQLSMGEGKMNMLTVGSDSLRYLPTLIWPAATGWILPLGVDGSHTIFTPIRPMTITSADIGFTTSGDCTTPPALIIFDLTTSTSPGAIGTLLNYTPTQHIGGLTVNLAAGDTYELYTPTTSTCATTPVANINLQYQMQ